MKAGRIKIWLITICLLGAPVMLLAQTFFNYSDYSGNIRLLGLFGPYVNENNYTRYYFNSKPIDSNKDRFGKVFEFRYKSTDSTMKKKKLEDEVVGMYNKRGQRTNELLEDSNFARYNVYLVYDDKFRVTSITSYERNDSGRIYQSGFRACCYDKNGNTTKDSAIDSVYLYNGKQVVDEVHVEYSRYDDSSNIIEYKALRKNRNYDTSINHIIYRYNKNNKLVYKEEIYESDTTQDYCRYNDKGFEVFSAEVRGNDSNYATYKYDNYYNLVERNEYTNGKLSNAYTRTSNKEGRIVETEEKLSTADAFSCPNNEVIVTVSDTQGYIYSVVTTDEKDGNPDVTTVIHKYTMSKGRVLIDSTFSDEEGYMYSEEEQSVATCSYDKNGNMASYTMEGSGETSSDFIYKWVYNNKNNLLRMQFYKSCDTMSLERSETYTYYSAGTKVKTARIVGGVVDETSTYNRNGRIIRKVRVDAPISIDNVGVGGGLIYYETIYKYKK